MRERAVALRLSPGREISDITGRSTIAVDMPLGGDHRDAGAPFESPKIPNESRHGAGDETRTRDIFLGKEVLYQLSYTRV